MHGFWYEFIKPIYNNNVKLCYIDTDSFVIYVRTEEFYKDISLYVEKMFDT